MEMDIIRSTVQLRSIKAGSENPSQPSQDSTQKMFRPSAFLLLTAFTKVTFALNQGDLAISLKAVESSVKTVEDIVITAIVTNPTKQDLRVLGVNNVLDASATQSFVIKSSEGKEVPFAGAHVSILPHHSDLCCANSAFSTGVVRFLTRIPIREHSSESIRRGEPHYCFDLRLLVLRARDLFFGCLPLHHVPVSTQRCSDRCYHQFCRCQGHRRAFLPPSLQLRPKRVCIQPDML
ncbi:hypothetical protein E1B28_011133 [Marasmius oreades]|uniref:Uncharacterized protein n=1 Tax=Marasmius oreades TaxID=181124 RepID=A0A9P7UPM6_9AGAR|nr:uncharacterized protein E1B28_011133 [Marasmius oreades]KAG7089448.1 hypothetical protein E1B28_011133 [Marasmius oreades]